MSLSVSRVNWARHFGSKSSNFRDKFLKAKKSNRDEDEAEDNPKTTPLTENNIDKIPDDYNYETKNDAIKAKSMDWIKKVVIGYNLCPFAERPLKNDKLKISVVRGNDEEYVAAAVVYELVARSDESLSGTTVVVAPEFHPDDFNRYMNTLHYIEDDFMDEHDLHGIVQIAPFHPKFEFAGSGEDGVDNYTNRSPYPMFHILREDEVGGAVDKLGGDASKVWSRNVRLLESMKERWGQEGVERAMRGEAMDGMDALLKEMKLSGYCDNKEGD